MKSNYPKVIAITVLFIADTYYVPIFYQNIIGHPKTVATIRFINLYIASKIDKL